MQETNQGNATKPTNRRRSKKAVPGNIANIATTLAGPANRRTKRKVTVVDYSETRAAYSAGTPKGADTAHPQRNASTVKIKQEQLDIAASTPVKRSKAIEKQTRSDDEVINLTEDEFPALVSPKSTTGTPRAGSAGKDTTKTTSKKIVNPYVKAASKSNEVENEVSMVEVISPSQTTSVSTNTADDEVTVVEQSKNKIREVLESGKKYLDGIVGRKHDQMNTPSPDASSKAKQRRSKTTKSDEIQKPKCKNPYNDISKRLDFDGTKNPNGNTKTTGNIEQKPEANKPSDKTTRSKEKPGILKSKKKQGYVVATGLKQTKLGKGPKKSKTTASNTTPKEKEKSKESTNQTKKGNQQPAQATSPKEKDVSKEKSVTNEKTTNEESKSDKNGEENATVTEVMNGKGCRFEVSFTVPSPKFNQKANSLIRDEKLAAVILKGTLNHILQTGLSIDPEFGIKPWVASAHPIQDAKKLPNLHSDLAKFIVPKQTYYGRGTIRYGRNWDWKINLVHPNMSGDEFLRAWESTKNDQRSRNAGIGYTVLNIAPIQSIAWHCVGFLAGSTEKIVTEQLTQELREITGDKSLSLAYRLPWLYNLTALFATEAKKNAKALSGVEKGTAFLRAQAVTDTRAQCIYVSTLGNVKKVKTKLMKKYSKHKKGEEWNELPDGSHFLFIPQMTGNVKSGGKADTYIQRLVRCHTAMKQAIIGYDLPIADPTQKHPSLKGKSIMQVIMQLKCPEENNRSFFHSIEKKWNRDPTVKQYQLNCLKYMADRAREEVRILKATLVKQYGELVLECFTDEAKQSKEKPEQHKATMEEQHIYNVFGIDIGDIDSDEEGEKDPFLTGEMKIGIDLSAVAGELNNTEVKNGFQNEPADNRFTGTRDPRDQPNSGMTVATAPHSTTGTNDDGQATHQTSGESSDEEPPPMLQRARKMAKAHVTNPSLPLSSYLKTTGNTENDLQFHVRKLIGSFRPEHLKRLYGSKGGKPPKVIITDYKRDPTAGSKIKPEEIESIIEHYAQQIYAKLQEEPPQPATIPTGATT